MLNFQLIFLPILATTMLSEHLSIEKTWRLNTSNQGKLHEFEHLFAQYGALISATTFDLREIQADPMTVAIHKASQLGDGILIEDTSLDIEGADVGINVKWLLENLSKLEGRKALWRVLLAYQKDHLIHVYEGTISGTIVRPRGHHGFGFDPVFLPDDSNHTLAESKPDIVNARAKAVEALLTGIPTRISSPILHWDGDWQ